MEKQQHFELTKEAMAKAKTYMPLREKETLAKQIAELSLDNIDTKKLGVANELVALPQLKEENLARKSCLLLNTLLGFYFDIELDAEKDGAELYDEYAGGHLLNQIERFKTDAELKFKAFDILSDYKEFKKMVDIEIYNLKTVHNDGLTRLLRGLSLFATPELVEQMTAKLKDQLADLQKIDEKKGGEE